MQKPLIDMTKSVNPLDGVTLLNGFGDGKDSFRSGLAQLRFQISKPKVLIANKPANSDLQHAERLLKGFFKLTTNGHDFTDRLHSGTNLLGNPAELLQIPARNLNHNVVEGWLETGHGHSRNGVLQIGQAMA